MIIGKIGNKQIDSSDLGIEGINPNTIGVFVRVALLTTLAGYLEKDNVVVNGKKFFSKQALNSFLSYVLNDKRAAPKTFELNFEFNGDSDTAVATENNDYDCVISFSGGVDSTASALYALDKGIKVLAVWIGFGQKNEADELRVVKKLCKELEIKLLIVKINLKSYVDAGWDRWKMGIIPARNLLFAAVASEIAAQSTKKRVSVYICAHKEEINYVNTDKSRRFYSTCNRIFSKIYPKNIELTTPFFNYTKPEIISFWKNHWSEPFGITPRETVSCYLGNNCGNCKACFNRAISFIVAGEKLDQYISHPLEDKQGIIDKGYIARFSKLQIERKLDILYALHQHKEIIPKSLKDFLKSRYHRYEAKINLRLKQLSKVKIR
jgi:7-cyano-7-deazaguanine synthase in queuosine biosynthesis